MKRAFLLSADICECARAPFVCVLLCGVCRYVLCVVSSAYVLFVCLCCVCAVCAVCVVVCEDFLFPGC